MPVLRSHTAVQIDRASRPIDAYAPSPVIAARMSVTLTQDPDGCYRHFREDARKLRRSSPAHAQERRDLRRPNSRIEVLYELRAGARCAKARTHGADRRAAQR